MISVIVVNYNTSALLAECLESLRRHEPEAQLIVVDNASRDDSLAMLNARFPDVTLVPSSTNRGFAGGNLQGFAHCAGDFVCLFNSDARLEGPLFDGLAAYLREHPEVGAISPRLIGMDGQRQQGLHRFPRLGDQLREVFRLPVPKRPASGEPGWLAGTALFLRRAALDTVGGLLDDDFFMYWEDADLSARLLEAGWQVVEHPTLSIRHLGGGSGGGPDAIRRDDLYAWYMWGKHRWYGKHRSGAEAAGVFLLDCINLPRMALRGLVRPGRRRELDHARALARVLWGRLQGRSPAPLD